MYLSISIIYYIIFKNNNVFGNTDCAEHTSFYNNGFSCYTLSTETKLVIINSPLLWTEKKYSQYLLVYIDIVV